MQTIKIEQTTKRYLSTLRYLEHIKKTGKINLLTRSQRNALRSRLFRYVACIKRYLKLATLSAGLFASSIIDMDAQCQMNRLPISNQTSFSTFQEDQKPAFVDIDRDGDFDLVTGNSRGTINTYENIDGFFKSLDGLLNPFNGILIGDASPIFVDIDSDGDPDAFIGTKLGDISFFRNDSGIFSEVPGTGNPLHGVDVGSFASPTFVDIDSDGDFDAFIGSAQGKIEFYRNDNGTFNEVTGAGNPLNGVDLGLLSYVSPTFIDIDHDGDSDVFIGSWLGKIEFYRNDNGTFNEVTGASNPLSGVDVGSNSNPVFIDIDSDGDPDAFIGTDSGIIRFFRNDNSAFFEVVHLDISFNGFDMGTLSAPFFGDLDGDNDEDLIVGLSDGTIRSFINTTGVFIEAVDLTNPFDDIDVGSRSKPVLIDINPTDSDQDLDLFVGASDGTIHFYKNTDGNFMKITGAGNPMNGLTVGSNAAPAFVDFDGDNDKDAFVGAEDGTIHYFRNDNGTFTEVTGASNPFNGVDIGNKATPAFFPFDRSRALVGSEAGTITEFKKVSNQYVTVANSPFLGVDVEDNSAPTILSGQNVFLGNRNGNIFGFSDNGGRSNVWQGPFTANWHGPSSNWGLMATPKPGCDDVHVFAGSTLKIDASELAEGRTLTVRNGGQFEVKAAAELNIDPN